MATTQFAMVEELASLIKDNLFCKHLVLSTEESLVSLLQDGTSLEGVIELQPMNSYDRLLVHRLADIYGFAHESVGEGDDRHLVLQRCPETAIPAILVSDILWQYDDNQCPAPSQHILRRKDSPATEVTETQQYSTPFEAREAAYLAARARIFSANLSDEKEVSAPKSRNIPVVARRMITHALGKNISSESNETTPGTRNSERNHKKSDPTERKTYERHGQNKAVRIKNQERDEAGAAKRMFASALGLSSTKGTPSLPVKSNGGNQSLSRDV